LCHAQEPQWCHAQLIAHLLLQAYQAFATAQLQAYSHLAADEEIGDA